MAPEKLHWSHLYREVVTSGLCTGCSACVVVCPYDVLGYDDQNGVYRPFHVPEMGGTDNCTHGEKGCTLCTRACPRFRSWESEVDTFLFGREREDNEVYGIAQDVILARATDPELLAAGQDGGLVSALLVWALEHDMIDAALVSNLEGDGTTWKAVPGVARNRADVIAAAGSRYTYSANPSAYAAAIDGGAERIALVGMGCQASVPAIMSARRAGKVARRFVLTIGLLCSKSFDDAIFPELFEARYGLARRGHREDEHQGHLPGVDPRWRAARGPAQRGLPVDTRGLQPLPRLRGRARGHLDGRHRRLPQLDAHNGPDRQGPGADLGDACRGRDRGALRVRRRPRRDSAAAQARSCESPPVA